MAANFAAILIDFALNYRRELIADRPAEDLLRGAA